MTQAIIENIIMFKDGVPGAGCFLTEGTVRTGDTLYYVDSMGKNRFAVIVRGIILPPNTAVESAAADGQKQHVILQLEGCSAQMLHVGYMLQSEREEEYYQRAPGCEAIIRRFSEHYPKNRFPAQFGAYTCAIAGERGVLDNIFVYNTPEYLHFVTCGLSELYEKQNGNPNRSGYGFELTCKLKKQAVPDFQVEIRHMCSLLQTVAKLPAEGGIPIMPGNCLATGFTGGFDTAHKSGLTGFVAVQDSLGGVRTEFGDVAFIQLVGVTDAQMNGLKEKKLTIQQVLEDYPGGLIDYSIQR